MGWHWSVVASVLASSASGFVSPLASSGLYSRHSKHEQQQQFSAKDGHLGMKLETVGGKPHTYEVVFVRHGQSTWNKANRFIGWTDAELTEEGEGSCVFRGGGGRFITMWVLSSVSS